MKLLFHLKKTACKHLVLPSGPKPFRRNSTILLACPGENHKILYYVRDHSAPFWLERGIHTVDWLTWKPLLSPTPLVSRISHFVWCMFLMAEGAKESSEDIRKGSVAPRQQRAPFSSLTVGLFERKITPKVRF